MKKIILLILFCVPIFIQAQSNDELKCMAYARVFDKDAKYLNILEKSDGNSDVLYSYKHELFIMVWWNSESRLRFTILNIPSLKHWDDYVSAYEQTNEAKALQKYNHYQLCSFDELKTK